MSFKFFSRHWAQRIQLSKQSNITDLTPNQIWNIRSFPVSETGQDLRVECCSVRGSNHELQNQPRQDAYEVDVLGSQLVVTVCDGVSNSRKSHLASMNLAKSSRIILGEVFDSQVTPQFDLWKIVNQNLTTELVYSFMKDMKRSGIDYPLDSAELRLATAQDYASTFEVLVVELKPSSSGEHRFLYSRVAGDGTLIKMSRKGLFSKKVWIDITETPVSNLVDALPVFDGDPLFLTGTIKKGESLIVTTDGFAEALNQSKAVRRSLGRRLNQIKKDESSAYLLMSQARTKSKDDLTFLTVSLK
jgi:serine/threonine protein phosphatase PrpC